MTPRPNGSFQAFARLVALLAGLATATAATPSKRGPVPNFDRRTESKPAAALSAARVAEPAGERALRARRPGIEIERDAITGAPKFIRARRGFLTGPNGEGLAVSPTSARSLTPGDRDRAAKAFLSEHRAVFGHGPEALTAARKTRDDTTAHSGLRTTVWQQELDGVPLFEARFQSSETARGELVSVASGFVTDPAGAAAKGVPQRAALLASPAIPAVEAVRIAATGIGDEVGRGSVTAATGPQGGTRRQEFRTAALNGAQTELIWLPMDGETLRLCWDVLFTSKVRGELYRVLVDVETGEPLVQHCLTNYATPASYRVWTSDSPSPFSPGHSTPLNTQPALVPQTLETLTSLNATASPDGWINDGVTSTIGNNVAAQTDIDNNDSPDLPRPDGGASRVFDFPADLTQAPTTVGNRRAAIVDLFYWCNLIHDRFYELGFTESAGNFQTANFGRGGLGNDAVQADAQDGSGTDNANFSTPPDGNPGRMQMYVFTGTTPDRDGDFDHEIVIHEYAHGLSNRLVGGGVGISALQPGGMGEGWSDFYGLCLLAQPGDDLNGCYAAGGYATRLITPGYEQNYYFGIRRYPYSTQLTKNPLTFKDIDNTQASTHAGIPRGPIGGSSASEVHNSGEVWCSALWEVRANLIAAHGFAIGNELVLQLVTDGMKIAPANPTFLQARDAIIQADQVKTGGANYDRLWAGFAKRGMGAYATSPGSNSTTGVLENFDPPDDLQLTPVTPFATGGPVGGPFDPDTKTYTLKNNGVVPLPFTATSTQPWLTLSPTSGSLAPNASVDIIVTVNTQANALTVGTKTATLSFTNTVSAISQSRPVSLIVTQPLQRFTIASVPAQFANHAFPLTVRAVDASNQTLPYYVGTVTLTAAAGGSAVPITPTVLSSFVNGISTTSVQIGQAANEAVLTVSDGAGHIGTSNSFNVTIGTPDYLTELFDTTVNDTAGATYTFTPVNNRNGYVLSRVAASAFPTTPTGGTAVTLSDDSFVQVAVTGGVQVRLFGVSYSSYFIGSNGYVTFGAGDIEYIESLANHFDLPRVTALFDDLLPGAPATISHRQLTDRVAITWQAIREFDVANSNNLQIELFFDGRIRITILSIAARDGLIGLSAGGGVPAGFVESDFSNYLSAPPTSTPLANQTILEDTATATLALTISDDATPAASLVLTAVSSNTALIPGVQFGGSGGSRTVRATPLPDQSGAATITVRVTDGQGRVTEVPFTVTVTPVNDVPVFVKGGDQTVLEDTGPQIVTGWATGMSSGPSETQAVEFIVDGNSNVGLFAAGPAVAADGTLTFTPAPDADGSATISVRLLDDGGTANGGVNTSLSQTFTITVTPINDAPSFVAGPSIVVNEDSGPQSIPGWATAISAGPASEAGQALTFLTKTGDPGLIVEATVSPNGTLLFATRPNLHGTTSVTVQLRDDGGTANGGNDRTSEVNFEITVNPVDDAPTTSPLADLTLDEDAPEQTVNLSGLTSGAPDEVQTLTVTAESSNPALIPQPVVTYSSPNSTGTLAFRPLANENGTATLTVTVSDGPNTTTRSFVVTVNAVNDAPTLAAIPDMDVLEDAGSGTVTLAGISPGPDNETQTLTITAVSSNPALVQPRPVTYMPESGQTNLVFDFPANASGSAKITVTVSDGQSVDPEAVRDFSVNILPVNDAPSFQKGANQGVRQSGGPQLVNSWATAISVGPAGEFMQNLVFVVGTSDSALFAVPPAISSKGTLTFTPAPNANGTATITVTLKDSGGTANGGQDTSPTETFLIHTTPVNDPPSFVLGDSQSVPQDAGAQVIPFFASAILPGPEDETAQSVDFIVTVPIDQRALFALPPVISPDGTLRFTPSPIGSGTATVSVRLHDDGGSDEGGVDTSEVKTFEIAVATQTEELGTYNGLALPAAGATPGAEKTGLLKLTISRGGRFTGRLKLGALNFALRGSFDKAGRPVFGRDETPILTLTRRNLPALLLTLQLDVSGGTDQLTGTITEGPAAFATINADRDLYSSRKNPAPPFRPVPASLLGRYTALLAARPPTAELPATAFPQGDGYARIEIDKRGVARIVGRLADGTPISYSNSLSKTNTLPLWDRSPRAKSVIAGMVRFRDVATSDVDGADLLWFKAARPRAKIYPLSWPAGIQVDLIGSEYRVLPKTPPTSVLPGLPPVDADGNAELEFTCTEFPAMLSSLSISTANRVDLVAPAESDARLVITRNTGLFHGTFTHPVTGRRTRLRGAILQKQQLGGGYFLSPTASGAVTLTPMVLEE